VPVFVYKAANAQGEVIQGTLEKGSRAEVVDELHTLGHIPIRIDESSARAPRRKVVVRRRRGLSHEQLAAATRELATLLEAGLPLDGALGILVELGGDNVLTDILAKVRESIQQGSSLADAMEAHPKAFGRFYVNLVRAGEAGGALESVLARLSEHLERTKEVRDSLTSALIYPVILLSVAGISIMVLVGYVVPQFKELFEGVGETLPLPTRVTLAVGDFLRHYSWALVLALAGGTWLFRRRLHNPRVRQRWDARLLGMPVVGDVVEKVEVARFARTLGALLNNGVPLLKALGISRDTVENVVIAQGIEQVAGSLKEGQSIAAPLAEAGCFPAFAVHMIRVGEESGRLEEMLLRVADIYDRETQAALKRALTFLEPLLILVLGAIIAGVIMSILVAMLGLNKLVV